MNIEMLAKILKIAGLAVFAVGFLLLFHFYDQAALAGLIVMTAGAVATITGVKTGQYAAARDR